MFKALLVLSVMSKHDSGVGLAHIIEMCEASGYFYSKYVMRRVLKELCEVGALHRVKNHYVMTLLGANISVADEAYSQGYGVGMTECLDYMPVYQRALENA